LRLATPADTTAVLTHWPSSVRRALVRLALIWSSWTLYALFTGSQSYLSRAYSQRVQFKPAFLYALLDSYTWALLTPVVLWLGARFAIQRKNWWRTVPLQVLFAIVFAIVHVLIFTLVLPLIGYQSSMRVTTSVFLARFHSDLLTYWLLIGLRHAVDYYRKFQDRELKATQLEARLAEAQLQVLKMQLQPHFLFNTLHAISALVHKDAEAADRMITRLAEFLRITLDSVGVQEIELRGELESLDKYLEIEQVRFGDRLTVVRSIEPETLDLLVPNLILQPLVENAVRHSIAPRAAGGRIEIRARREGNNLVIDVVDDGGGENIQIREGVGLTNTRARLQQLYGRAQSVDISAGHGTGFRVTLSLPAREKAMA
jgi:two-component system LytT family sensor kinase